MYLGRVIGTVVAARKYEGLEGKKLLVKASCAILELTPYIDVAPYTPVW